MPTTHRAACALFFAFVACSPAGAPSTQWPERAVRIVVPSPPGTSTDLAARLLAPQLALRWKQPVVVDNRPSGDGVAGVAAFIAEADDHALLFAALGVVTANVLLHARLPFDAQRDLMPIAGPVSSSIGIAVARGISVLSLAELVRLARKSPGRLRFAGSPGLPDLMIRTLIAKEHLAMTRVSYREIPQAVRDLSDGRIEVLAVALPTMKAALDAGMIRLIAVNASTRLASEPGVPTVAESGWPDLTVDSPQGLFADRRADAVLRTRIAADVSEAVMDAGVATRLAQLGFSVHASTPEAFAAAIARQKRQLEVMTRISARNDVGAQR